MENLQIPGDFFQRKKTKTNIIYKFNVHYFYNWKVVEYIPYVIWISTENWNDYDDWNEQCPGMILNRIDKRLKCLISNKMI